MSDLAGVLCPARGQQHACPACEQPINSCEELAEHVKQQHARIICLLCVKRGQSGELFHNLQAFQYHGRERHAFLKCPHCGSLLPTPEDFQQHTLAQHGRISSLPRRVTTSSQATQGTSAGTGAETVAQLAVAAQTARTNNTNQLARGD